MNFTIRKARLSDANDLARLYLQFWEAHKNCDPLLEFKRKITLKNQIEHAKKDVRKRNIQIFVAVKDSKVIGFIELLIKKNDECFKIKEYGYLNSAVTHKDYRSQGVARALTNSVMKFLKDKGIKFVKTNVYNTNKAAMKTWQRLGFHVQSSYLVKKP